MVIDQSKRKRRESTRAAKARDKKPAKSTKSEASPENWDSNNVGIPRNVIQKLNHRIAKAKATYCIDLSVSSIDTVIEYKHEVIPDQVYDCLQTIPLKQLWLTNNRIAALPPEIKLFKNLRILGLSGNRLQSLPDEIGALEGLERLLLDKNQLSYLPKTIPQLKDLQELQLDHNEFKYFPMQVTLLPGLRRLGLSYNSITHIPADIRKLRNLIELDLDYNRIGPKIPDELKNLHSLKKVGLQCNRIESDDNFLSELCLDTLRISGNRSAEYKVVDKKSGEVVEGVIIPVRPDGYLQLRLREEATQEIGPLEGHMECAKQWNMKNGAYYRDESNPARNAIHVRSYHRPWSSVNRLEPT